MSEHVDLAGYLVETLSPEQRREVEGHLSGCARCRDEVESLRSWRTALESVPEAMLMEGPPDGGDLLLQRTLRQVRQESSGQRHRSRALLASAAAVVAVAVIGAGVLAGRATAPETPTAQPPIASVPTDVPGTRTGTAVDPTTGARITAAVAPAPGWVRVTAAVSGIPAGERCILEVVAKDGYAVQAGSWIVSPAGEAGGTTLNGSALIDPSDVASVRVVNTAGKQFTSVDV
ncbi:anti-sigma factor family protein [Paractinoplanes atraurantiacus]|uniref:RNA polymerase sigma-70 factor, ECF subfamily n=1 Tax=Paractinoplanes atraurantiacus TaxID=1036182 RepID=A0A285JKR6_9ACTN|nr:zf-HC2 domain-containing protein [Actinoplanes atraurantiacus]SNY60858.1 RNA polymerase sigma-70 factor, ECF subfamily [Actinoplanes atraurantiacus]